jgi:hypothetical protein
LTLSWQATSEAEDEMHSFEGRVSMFLHDSRGSLYGFLLSRGQEIRFSVTPQNVKAVRRIARASSQVKVEGELRVEGAGDQYLQASMVTNLDSKHTAILPALNRAGEAGMLSDGAPTQVTSPAHLNRSEVAPIEKRGGEDSETLQPAAYFHGLLVQSDGCATEDSRNRAAGCITNAYDNLHRIQAVLAYLHIIKHTVPGISQFLDEAKRTYEQALGSFGARNFTAAKEFAEASSSLSRLVGIVMARTLRSDTSLPSLVAPPPNPTLESRAPEEVEEHLARAEAVLSRIHWVLENGTLPCEDRAQVRKIASWGDAFYKQARRTYRNAIFEDASELAEAALEGAHSAEHVCRKWYVHNTFHP